MPTDIAAELNAFCESMERESLEQLSGRKIALSLGPIFDRFGDIFRVAEIAALDSKEDEAFTDRDRKAITLLRAALGEWHVEGAVRELTEEIATREARAEINLAGTFVPLRAAYRLVEAETRPDARREIASRTARAFAETNDLRAARVEGRHAAAARLGAGSVVGLLHKHRGVDLRLVALEAGKLLRETETRFAAALESTTQAKLGRRLAQCDANDVVHALGLRDYDRAFSADRLPGVYRGVLAGIGIRTGAQESVQLDIVQRPTRWSGAVCAAIDPPANVALSAETRGGYGSYVDMLVAAGQAQLHAFTSSDARAPFVRAGDPATPLVFGHLFGRLMSEPFALAEFFEMDDARGIVVTASTRHAASIRREAASIAFAVEILERGTIPSGAAASYDGWMHTALLVDGPAELHAHAVDAAVHMAHSLRARAVEVMLRERLKLRFGSRWWQARAAGDLLKEIWSTGSEYTAAELASQMGLGDPSFDHLVQDMNEELLK